MKNLTTTSYTYDFPEVDSVISNWKKSNSSLAEFQAKSNAEQHLPKETGDKFIRYMGLFAEKAKDIIRKIDDTLKIIPSLYLIKQLREARDIAVGKYQNKIHEFREKLADWREDHNQFDHKIISITAILFLVAYILLAVAEAIFSFKPFKFLTGNVTVAWIISIVFAFIWVLGAEKFGQFWNSGLGLKRIIRRILIFCFCTSIFYFVAYLRILERATSRAIINNEVIPGFSDINQWEVFILTAVGWLFFLGAVWLAENTPSYKEIVDAIKSRLRKIQVKRCERKIAQLEKLIREENQLVADEEHKTVCKLNKRSHGIKDVTGYLKHLEEQFKTINITYRNDGVYPDCFDQAIVYEVDTTLPNINQDIVEVMQTINQPTS